jgi:hypothetical protein
MKISALLLASLLAGVLAVPVIYREFSPSSPTVEEAGIDFPTVVTLEEQWVGSIATARWTVSNRGGRPLLVKNIQSSCGCSSLEIQQDNSWVTANELRLAPGESRDCRVRVLVSKEAGLSSVILQLTESGTIVSGDRNS